MDELITEIRHRHYEATAEYGQVCFTCMPERWPCAAIRAANALEAWSKFADYAAGKHDGVPPITMHLWTALLFDQARAARQGSGEGA